MDLDKIKSVYLSHIKIHIESPNLGSTLIRDFADRWFAYYKKGPFLKKTNSDRWFNGLNAIKLNDMERDGLLQMHFISKNALEAINQKLDVGLVKDHSVPIKILHNLLIDEEFQSLELLEKFLLKYYTLGVITHEEHKILDQLNLKSEMPHDWDGINVFARYEKADIQKADIFV